jgi:RNA polymerase sigma-70 factor (ECF subfamily)
MLLDVVSGDWPDSQRQDAAARDETVEFAAFYERWFDDVVRWIPAMGGRASDVEDLAQEVFLIARRKLANVDGKNPGGWLYAIALRTVANHRRLAWFRHLIFLSDDAPVMERHSRPGADPATLVEQRELLELADRALDNLKPIHRRAFLLFEVEGYSGEEIAELEQIPLATVWTRLHQARKLFVEETARLHKKGRR